MTIFKMLRNSEIKRRTFFSFIPLTITIGLIRGIVQGKVTSLIHLADVSIAVLGVLTGLAILYASSYLSSMERIDKGRDDLIFIFSSILLGILLLGLKPDLPNTIELFNGMQIFVLTCALEGLLILFFKGYLSSWKFIVPTVSHLFDASTTVYSLKNDGMEINPVANFIMSFAGNYSIFLLKLGIIFPVAYYLATSEEEFTNVTVLLISALGIAIGISNLLI